MSVWGGGFLNPQQFLDIFNNNAFLIVISCGLTIVMIAGGIGGAFGDLGKLIANAIAPKVAEYGLSIPEFYIENISLPEEVEKALDTFPGISSSAVYGVALPSGDGRAGMAAILPAEGSSIDHEALCAHLRSSLPKYAVPLFIRFIDGFQMTATHKIKKTDFRKEGYDPKACGGRVSVLLPGSDAYMPLDEALYGEIMAGKYNF